MWLLVGMFGGIDNFRNDAVSGCCAIVSSLSGFSDKSNVGAIDGVAL